MYLARETEALEPLPTQKTYQYKLYPNAQRISAHRFAAAMLVSDILALVLTGIVPIIAYKGMGATSSSPYLAVIGGGLFLFLLLSRVLNVYRTKHVFSWRHTMPRAAASLLFTFFALTMISVATKTTADYSRVWFFSWLSLSLVLIVSLRAVMLAVAEAKLTKGACHQRALIITCGANTFTGAQLALETANRIRAVGKIIAHDLASIPELGPYIQKLDPQVIVLNVPWFQVEAAMGHLTALSRHPVEVLVLPQASVGVQKIIRLRRLGQQTFFQMAEPPLVGWDRVIKRVEDVVVASLALLITAPVLLLTALAIKWDSPGPVLFKQMRAGFNGRLVEVWKFRSMAVEGTDLTASRQTSKDDPRVTRVGRFIRRTSLDELPQFWNVLQGTMSVVGPRPHALHTSAEGRALDALVEEYASRHRVKPGITGWAQINGARGELRSREQVKKRVDYDLYYIDNWSILLDIKIILMTVVRVFYDPRAY
jgi:Undecaprenyl-phosphate glucose phosphotransferase